jgi:phosphoglycerol transferase MdoB-like AlkP superfamily enzyme
MEKPSLQAKSSAHGRGKVLRMLVVVYLVISLLDRAVLFIWSPAADELNLLEVPTMLLVGIGFDLIAVSWLLMPATLYSLIAPRKLLASRVQGVITRGLVFLYLAIFLFNTLAGWVFWEEFSARYNFIAVDYLVYTKEVIGNIVESYPMPWILGGLAGATACLYFGLRKSLRRRIALPITRRRRGLLPLLVLPLLAWPMVDISLARVSPDRYRNEITKDGLYSLFSAFRSNALEFPENFAHLDLEAAYLQLRDDLAKDGLEFVSDDVHDLRRHHVTQLQEHRYNVVVIVVESLSAQFLTMFKDQGRVLTPRLDALAKESMVYSKFFATGSRTVRGLEALSLSVPPTPGRSIIKRPGNEALDSIAWPFRDRGYDARFMYGGHGYFDNMNYFFSSNGFDIVDRADLDDSEISFTTSWGVCDQDIFARALKESDRSFEAGRPFFSMIMTTSNHRPYTYPDVVPIPPGTGRAGAVLYTDFAIGEFIDAAKQHSWFENTIFVVVGDHCAGSAGKRDIAVAKHHIPLLFYAPGIVEAGVNDRLASQIDFAPTLLALLDFDYTARFFGHNLADRGSGRAPVGNYQTLGLMVDDELCILQTKEQVECYQVSPGFELQAQPTDQKLLRSAIALYQVASASFFAGGLSSGRDVSATRY